MVKLQNSKKVLLKNTILLYILQFSSQFFALLTIPYQTRILGPEIYGEIGFVVSVMTYVQLILDFGFLLSATAEVSLNRDNPERINQIYTVVFFTKVLLSVILFVPIYLMCRIVPRLESDTMLVFLYYVGYAVNALSPDFFYRGIENMKVITVRTILIKFVFVILIFVFLKEPSDYYVIPVLTFLGSLTALITILIYTRLHYGIHLVFVPWALAASLIRQTIPFFISRIASTLYTATNTFVLGLLYPMGPVLGYYTSTDKLVSAVKGVVSPVADSLYPYMTKRKDFKLIKRILIVAMPFIMGGAVFGWIYANKICVILFGEEYYDAGELLQLLIPAMMVILPSYILAFPTLNPLGLAKYANRSNIYGAAFQMLGLLALFVTKFISIRTICILTSCTECIVLVYRIFVIVRFKVRNEISIKT